MQRPLHDIDFLAQSFADIPDTFAEDFLLRHVHPNDPPGKTLVQAVLPETALRCDVFRAYGHEMARASQIDWKDLIEIRSTPLRMVSAPDLAARHARLCWDLVQDRPVAFKFARDFLRLIAVVPIEEVNSVWPEHKKPDTPHAFSLIVDELKSAIARKSDLLIDVQYSQDPSLSCPRCRASATFPLAPASQILSLLGYC